MTKNSATNVSLSGSSRSSVSVDPVQDPRDDPPRQKDERHEDDRRRAERQHQGHDVAPERAQLGQQHHQHDRREVLDDENADDHAAVARAELPAVGQEARGDHRGLHAERGADRERDDGRPAQLPADAGRQRDERGEPGGSAGEREPLHAQEVGQRQLDAEREHQENDADLGQELEGLDVRDHRPRREGPDQEAGEDVAQDQRLAREARERATHDGGEENVGEVPEDRLIGYHL